MTGDAKTMTVPDVADLDRLAALIRRADAELRAAQQLAWGLLDSTGARRVDHPQRTAVQVAAVFNYHHVHEALKLLAGRPDVDDNAKLRSDIADWKNEVRELVAERDKLRAENERLRAQVAAVESHVEYGHQLPDGQWLPEYRGIKYAEHQRTVHWRADEPVTIDHWTYADHRHPVEGCTHDRHDLTTRAALDVDVPGRNEEEL